MDLFPTAPADSGSLSDLDPADVHDAYERRGLSDLSDDQLFDVTARLVSQPKRDVASSFTLHAPLELLARRALLEYVPPAVRDGARERMLWVAATYRTAADPAEPVAVPEFASVSDARAALVAAIAAADLDAVDAAAAWMGDHAATDDIVGLAPALVDSLAAAGHASIYFHLLPRVAVRSASARTLLRPLAREVARVPSLRIEWIRDGVEGAAARADAHALAVAIAGTPRLGLPGSDFVFPIVHQVDGAGPARDIVGSTLPASLDAAAAAIVRVAALSMLQDDPGAAPYGWTHCLTLPQAVLGVAPRLANPAVGAAIAATYVVGFRAALSANDIEVGASYEPERPRGDTVDALGAAPTVAAAAAWHAPDAEISRVVSTLAQRAARHEDAHLAKYTLACLDAIARDPGQRRLYLAAAAYLGAWWSAAPGAK